MPDTTAPAGADAVAPPAPAPPFPLEPEFQGALSRLRARKPGWSTGLVLVGSLALYLLASSGGGDTAAGIAILVMVILLHESGHWLAMRASGYRDVRLFFIPFFGGGTTGRRAGVAPWKEGLVLLAGPLPGILLGLVLAAALPAQAGGAWPQAVVALVFINALNLLPVAALDGGRLLELTVFQRHRWLEIGFGVVASLGLAAVAVALEAWLLGALALFTLLALPARARLLREVHGLRALGLGFPAGVEDADTAAGREVFLAARRLDSLAPARSQLDAWFESLLDRVGRGAPSALQSAFLLGAWGFGFVLALAAVVVMAVRLGPPA
jgi:Zn-dependent protease